jgi:hypothetical protein
MRELLLALLQLFACGVIFVTGALWLNDLPTRMGARWGLRKVALVLVTGASAFQAFRPADQYVCALLLGIALELVTQRDVPWLRWVWRGHAPHEYRGFERRRGGRIA